MKSKKPIKPRWWQVEIGFMQSAGFRVVMRMITLAVIGYCGYSVSVWIIQKREHNRLLRLDQEANPSGYVPRLPSPPFKNEGAPNDSPQEVTDGQPPSSVENGSLADPWIKRSATQNRYSGVNKHKMFMEWIDTGKKNDLIEAYIKESQANNPF